MEQAAKCEERLAQNRLEFVENNKARLLFFWSTNMNIDGSIIVGLNVVALYAGLLGLILLLLSYKVVKSRQKFEVGIGDGDQEELNRAIRVQGNFIEYVPLALILLVMSQVTLGYVLLTHIAGATLVISRVMHAQGLGKTIDVSTGRFVGIILTWLVLLVLSVANVYAFVIGSI